MHPDPRRVNAPREKCSPLSDLGPIGERISPREIVDEPKGRIIRYAYRASSTQRVWPNPEPFALTLQDGSGRCVPWNPAALPQAVTVGCLIVGSAHTVLTSGQTVER